MKRSLFFVLFSFCLVFIQAQVSQLETESAKIYQSYLSDNPDLWKEGIEGLERLYLASGKKNAECLFNLALGRYGLIGYRSEKGLEDGLDDLIDLAEENAEALMEYPGYASEANALLGGLAGMKISLAPLKAIFLGPKSSGYITEALQLEPGNPTAWVEKGNMRFHAPKTFGGDKEEAIVCYQKAITLFEKQPDRYRYNWLYLHTYAWLGQSYQETGKTSEAAATYRKVLEIAPDFEWVKNELLPSVQ